MKYIFVILSVILSLVSVGCVEYEEASYVKYSLTRSWETGDPHDVERCIKVIVKSATERMTTSDYEDVDDTVTTAGSICINMYSRYCRKLNILYIERGSVLSSLDKKVEELTPDEKKIFDELMTGKKDSLKVYCNTY